MGSPLISTPISNFVEIKSRKELAQWLGVSDRRLRYILYKLSPSQKYARFEINKNHGGKRIIDAPSKPLKAIQRKLLASIAELAPARAIAKGYVKGKSIFDHASIHRSRRWVVLADISDFFPSINFGRVRGALLSKPFEFPPEVATCIAQICCNEGSIPQGAPTSPAISNLICRRLDRELLSIAKKHKLSVSRYADDICFSTNLKELPGAIATIGESGAYVPGSEIVHAMTSNGFALNTSKFKVEGRRNRQMVTGLVVNRGISIPRRWRRQLRVMMNVFRRHGETKGLEIVKGWRHAAIRQGDAKTFEQALRGKISYAHWIDGKADRSYVRSLFRAYPDLRSLLPRLGPSVPFRVMTEGASDLLHLSAALKSFHARGEYVEIEPRFLNFSGDTNDAELWETLRRIAKADVNQLTIGVFDCDAPEFMKKRALEPGVIMPLGSKVFALCLARPPVIAANEPFCIELLYARKDAARDTPMGRRIFFKDEFDSSGLHSSGLYSREFPSKKTLVLSETVTRISDGASVALGKMDFARLIESGEEPFSDVSFEGFRSTFDLIREIIDEVEGL